MALLLLTSGRSTAPASSWIPPFASSSPPPPPSSRAPSPVSRTSPPSFATTPMQKSPTIQSSALSSIPQRVAYHSTSSISVPSTQSKCTSSTVVASAKVSLLLLFPLFPWQLRFLMPLPSLHPFKKPALSNPCSGTVVTR